MDEEKKMRGGRGRAKKRGEDLDCDFVLTFVTLDRSRKFSPTSVSEEKFFSVEHNLGEPILKTLRKRKSYS